MAGLIDTHLHLGRDEFDGERDAVVDRARAAGVGAFLHVGFDELSIAAAQAMAESYAPSWCAAGIHPHEAASYDEGSEALLRELARAGRIVAIGECGLDFFRDLSPRLAQHEAFRRQIVLSNELDLPMIFHVRDAYDEAKEALLASGLPSRRGVFHAFAGDAAFARWAVDQGFRLGIGGPLTYKKARLPEAIAGLPADSFLLETDAPWLPPQPWRGRRNEPAYLRVTAARLAELTGMPLDDLSDRMAHTFQQLFSVQLPEDFMAQRPSTLAEPSR